MLNKAEKNYSTTHKELLAVVFVLRSIGVIFMGGNSKL